MSPIGPIASTPSRQSAADTPAKVLDAAQQFESLLLSQILRAARESGGGWMGTKDASAECATDYAEQQFATVMAKQGGLGLANLIAKGLERASK
jgi:Rod binding domain-containing protein